MVVWFILWIDCICGFMELTFIWSHQANRFSADFFSLISQTVFYLKILSEISYSEWSLRKDHIIKFPEVFNILFILSLYFCAGDLLLHLDVLKQIIYVQHRQNFLCFSKANIHNWMLLHNEPLGFFNISRASESSMW